MSEQITRQRRRANPPIALIGAPTDIGAGHRGSSMGPEALRVAGIEAALRRLGCAIEDRGNIAGPVNPDASPVNGYRHLEETTIWCQAVRDAVHDALRRGSLPILLGGDHSLSIGSIAGVARYCAAMQRPLSVLWLDAHADFNTPDTSPSGNIHGMPVAVIAGHGPGRLMGLGDQVPMVDPSRIIQLGVRSIDASEKHLSAERRAADMPDKLQDLLDIEAELGAHNYAPRPVVLSRGEGVWLWDVDGNRYLDCLSAYSAVNQGHCHLSPPPGSSPHTCFSRASRPQLNR
jgi:arginase family enzyme